MPLSDLLRSVCRDDIALLSEGESTTASFYNHCPPDGGLAPDGASSARQFSHAFDEAREPNLGCYYREAG